MYDGWHYETLDTFGIREEEIPEIRKKDPEKYEAILRSEWNRCCEDTRHATDYERWKARREERSFAADKGGHYGKKQTRKMRNV